MSVLKDYYNTGYDGDAGIIDVTAWQSMCFIAGSDYNIYSVKLRLRKNGTPNTVGFIID